MGNIASYAAVMLVGAIVAYELTDKGRSLGPVIDSIREWGEAWAPVGAKKH